MLGPILKLIIWQVGAINLAPVCFCQTPLVWKHFLISLNKPIPASFGITLSHI